MMRILGKTRHRKPIQRSTTRLPAKTERLKKMTRNRFDYFITPMAALPAVLVGAVAMKSHAVNWLIATSNLVFVVVGWLISCYVIYKNSKSINGTLLTCLIIALYALTFVDPGIDNVHRWLSFGPINLYISSIFAPILIIELWTLLKNNKDLWVSAITITVAILLVLQPDASQLTAFSIPMGIMIYHKINNKFISSSTIGILVLLVILSWIHLDSLPAVDYVEEILGLVMNMGFIWTILGIVSLILIPLPFFVTLNHNERLLSRFLGLYFTILIITTFLGNFPVPLMGYGISPIAGYLLAMTWMIKNKDDKHPSSPAIDALPL